MTENLRANSFDTFAQLYETYRPRYSWSAFAPLVKRAGIGPGAQLLEIGCGSGQATEALTGRGFKIVAIDPGRALLDLAAKKLPLNEVNLVPSKFEDFQPREYNQKFDFAYAVTSFHWVDQKVGYRLLHKLLKDGACFANISVSKIWPQKIRQNLDQLYSEFEHEFANVHASFGGAETRTDEKEATRYFQTQDAVDSVFDLEYSADTYVGLMRTMSDHRLLPQPVQEDFFHQLHRVCSSFGAFSLRYKLTAKFYQKKPEQEIG